MTFAEWQKKAQEYATWIDLPDDLWDKKDSYDLLEAAKDSFEGDISPELFIDEMFADEIASRKQALEYEADLEETE
jgi:hypothetical protein